MLTTRRARLALLLPLLALVAAGGWWIADGDDEVPAGMQAVDYGGLRIYIPDSYVVQSVHGKVDGELACPDAPGFVFADDGVNDATYTKATCNPPGEEVVVRIIALADGEPDPKLGPVRQVGDVRYQRRATWVVVYLDRPLVVSVEASDRTARTVLDSIVRTMALSPSDGRVTPTTAPAHTAVTDRLAVALGCLDRTKASTYARVDNGFLGRQREAPVDCSSRSGGHRILVFAYPEAREAAMRYYDRVWLVVGENWIVTAMHEDAARAAAERVGGTLRPPSGQCCGPPTSDQLPG